MKESEIRRAISEKFGIEKLNAMQDRMAEMWNRQAIILLAPTGTGKTLAYAVPLLKNLREPDGRVQAVVIAPSRELVVQTGRVLQPLAVDYKLTCCYGGHNFDDERNSLSIVPDIIVATPGRLLDHLKRGSVSLRSNRILVLDEFDKSLDLGFHEEMRKIIRTMPDVSRLVLTSATALAEFPPFLNAEGAVTLDFLGKSDRPSARMTVRQVLSDNKDKLETLRRLLNSLDNGRTIVFANHRESAERIFSYLIQGGFPAGIYHGGLDQIEREKAIAMFNNGTFMILVTTDLGSRGLDISEVRNVVHYHLPVSRETYIHRNGRTARVDAEGDIFVITSPVEKLPDYIRTQGVFGTEHGSDAVRKFRATVATLYFGAGRKEKISRGDILGFLIAKGGLEAREIGKIDVADHYALAAVPPEKLHDILGRIVREKIKNRRIRIATARQQYDGADR